jgi:hypothetical protein
LLRCWALSNLNQSACRAKICSFFCLFFFCCDTTQCQ